MDIAAKLAAVREHLHSLGTTAATDPALLGALRVLLEIVESLLDDRTAPPPAAPAIAAVPAA